MSRDYQSHFFLIRLVTPNPLLLPEYDRPRSTICVGLHDSEMISGTYKSSLNRFFSKIGLIRKGRRMTSPALSPIGFRRLIDDKIIPKIGVMFTTSYFLLSLHVQHRNLSVVHFGSVTEAVVGGTGETLLYLRMSRKLVETND